MDPLDALRTIHRAETPREAFSELCEMLSGVCLRAGAWVRPEGELAPVWPAGATVSRELIATALHLRRPEAYPLGSEFHADSTRHPGAEVLFLPLREGERHRGTCLLIGEEGFSSALGVDPEALVEALYLCDVRSERAAEEAEKRKDLQRRVEQTEALHTLGLAVNRTLHPKEVLQLVARFTRSLLGADYVTVSTAREGRVHTLASVGVRDSNAAGDDYLLARSVVETEKPIVVGAPGAAMQVDHFPFHAAEGMKVGLGIPLSLFGQTFGALVIGYRAEVEITPRDTRFALSLAGHAAVAISNARLHEQVQEHSERLEEAYTELRNLTQAKERFFASINHELRNPIGAVMGYLTLVLDGTAGEIPAGAEKFLRKADRAAHTLLELVNDILDLSKLAAGKMDVSMQECTVEELVEGAVATMQPLADQKAVPLLVDSFDGLPPLHTDAQRVQQILVNLISNAIKFTGEGGVRVAAALHEIATESPGASPGAWLDLRVSDTGPGLSPQNQGVIFEEFEQVKGTKGGTGLGLPISRRLARLLGGDLLVDSEVGKGSTFILRLPGPPVAANRLEPDHMAAATPGADTG